MVSNQLKGTLYCFFGVLILTPDSLLLREVANVSNYVVLFYRFAGFSVCTMAIVVIFFEGSNVWNRIRSLNSLAYSAGIIWGLSQISFAIGIQNTSAANVVVINSSSPIFSAVFEYLFLSEKPKVRTIVTGLIAIGSIVLLFAGDLGKGDNVFGLLAALGSSIAMGLYFAIIALSSKSEKSKRWIHSKST